jgi:hypothetical protein
LKKFFTKLTKKVINKNVADICTFSTFNHVCQTCFADNFFGVFFRTFAMALESVRNFAFFDTFFDFLKKIFGLRSY